MLHSRLYNRPARIRGVHTVWLQLEMDLLYSTDTLWSLGPAFLVLHAGDKVHGDTAPSHEGFAEARKYPSEHNHSIENEGTCESCDPSHVPTLYRTSVDGLYTLGRIRFRKRFSIHAISGPSLQPIWLAFVVHRLRASRNSDWRNTGLVSVFLRNQIIFPVRLAQYGMSRMSSSRGKAICQCHWIFRRHLGWHVRLRVDCEYTLDTPKHWISDGRLWNRNRHVHLGRLY